MSEAILVPAIWADCRARLPSCRPSPTTAEGMWQQLSHMNDTLSSMKWTGDGADKIKSLVESSVPDIHTFWTAHGDAAQALNTYVSQLETIESQAKAALAAYSTAVSDLGSANAAVRDAASRKSTAESHLSSIATQLHQQQAKRLLEVAAQQSTTATDHQIALLTSQRNYQTQLHNQAVSDLNGANSRVGDAQGRMTSARKKIDGYRDQVASDGKTAATAILAAVGIVRSHNPFVRAWQNTVGVADEGG